MADFFYAFGYGLYVWSAYGITLFLLLGLILQSLLRHKKAQKTLRDLSKIYVGGRDLKDQSVGNG